jgi:hypothetical protein
MQFCKKHEGYNFGSTETEDRTMKTMANRVFSAIIPG